MRKLALFAAIVVSATLLIALPASAALPVETPACDAFIDHSIKLGADVGSQALPCSGDGLHVQTDGVTINLGGRTIWGTNNVGAGLTSTNHTGVRFTNGRVRGFFDAIRVTGASEDVTVDRMLASGASHAGLLLTGNNITVTGNTFTGDQRLGIYGGPVTFSHITYNTISGNGLGGILLLGGSNDDAISHNSVHGNTGDGINVPGDRVKINKNNVQGNTQWGINVTGNLAKFARNTLKGNTSGGLLVAGDAPSIIENIADGNGWSTTPGLGIDASQSAAPAGSGNIARNNGDPQECDPTVIC